jgi:hypothetical protein
MMKELLTYLSSDTGSAIVGALLVTGAVQLAKKLCSIAPGDAAVLKQIVAAITSLIAALAASALAGTLTVGIVVVKLLQVWGGATLLHSLLLRSVASKTPG